MNVNDVLGHVDNSDALTEPVAGLEGQLSEVSERLEATANEILNKPDSVTLLKIVNGLENRQQELNQQLENAKQQLHTAGDGDVLHDTKELIDALTNTTGDTLIALRKRLQSRLRDLIDVIWIFVNAGLKVQRWSGSYRRSESAALITLAR